MEKAPSESYADVGGLEQQIQEIKEAVELPLTHPELYEDIGIKPPKVGVPRDLQLTHPDTLNPELYEDIGIKPVKVGVPRVCRSPTPSCMGTSAGGHRACR